MFPASSADLISFFSFSVKSTCRYFFLSPSSAFASSAFGLSAGAGAASAATSLPSAFARKVFSPWIRDSLSSVPSSEDSLMQSRYASIASRQRNRRSIISLVTFTLSLRTSWNTSSMSWVRCCMRLNPMVPAIPFKECAARKISLITSLLSGSFSKVMILSLRLWMCSLVSSIKISRYWLTSILLYPHILNNFLCHLCQRSDFIHHSGLHNRLWHAIDHTGLGILCNNIKRFFLPQ